MSDTVTKSEAGGNFPASDYAYVPDPKHPSTWKLRLTKTPGGTPDAGIVGAAIAALGKGFRGQKVDIPAADLPAVKAKIRAAWLKANPDKKPEEMPDIIKAAGFPVAPLRLADKTLAAGDVTPVMLFPIGRWKSDKYASRYPDGLPLTQDTADQMIANFDAGVLGGDVQFSVAGAHGVPAAAAFWVQRLYCAPYEWQGRTGDALWADVQWTQAGADAVNGDEFRYLSIEAGDITTNDGDKVPWVLQGGVLTNYPVIRIMPPIKDAPNAIAAASGPREAELEIDMLTLAGEDDPVQALLDSMDEIAAKLDEALKGKTGMPAVRTMMREIRAKVSAHKMALADDSYRDKASALEDALKASTGRSCWVEDFSDDWVVFSTYNDGVLPSRTYRASYTVDASGGYSIQDMVEVTPKTIYVPTIQASDSGSRDESGPGSPAGSQHAKAGEGQRLSSNEGLAAQKGVTHMSKVTEYLSLADDAPEELILAEVRKIEGERDAEKQRAEAAETKLAEIEKEQAKAKAEAALAELIEGGHLAPASKEAYLALAEKAPAEFEAILNVAKQQKVVEFGERGDGGKDSAGRYPNASVELAAKARARKQADGISFAEATRLILAEDHDLKARYEEFRAGKEG